MINGTNLLGKDNPGWLNRNPAETVKLLAVPPMWLTAPRRERRRGIRVPARIADLPRRIGARLFRRCDTEAGWRSWQITELRGGFARSYRDTRFDVLRQLSELTGRYGGERGTDPADECEAPEAPGAPEAPPCS